MREVVADAVGRIARRKDGKHFLYLPKGLVEDSAFPFGVESSAPVRVVIDRLGKKLIVMPLTRSESSSRKGR